MNLSVSAVSRLSGHAVLRAVAVVDRSLQLNRGALRNATQAVGTDQLSAQARGEVAAALAVVAALEPERTSRPA
jgi:hypothetical protein